MTGITYVSVPVSSNIITASETVVRYPRWLDPWKYPDRSRERARPDRQKREQRITVAKCGKVLLGIQGVQQVGAKDQQWRGHIMKVEMGIGIGKFRDVLLRIEKLTVTPDKVAAAPTIAYTPGFTQFVSPLHTRNMPRSGWVHWRCCIARPRIRPKHAPTLHIRKEARIRR